MKKKSLIIIYVVVVVLVMLIPIPLHLNDGGSIEYRAILYKVTKYHKISSLTKGYDKGWKVEILGITLYDEVNTYVETENEKD